MPESNSTQSTEPDVLQTSHKPAGVVRTLDDDLTELLSLAARGPVTFGQMVDALHERAAISLLVILSFAFMLVPVPGVSTASSVIFVLLGVSAVFGFRLYLPGWLRRRAISQEWAVKMLTSSSRLWGRVSKLVKPRLTFLAAVPLRWLAGVSLLAGIVAFALPIPIPFNNSPPAFCMLLLALGLLGRDGLILILGHLATWTLWVILFVFGDFIWTIVQRVVEKFQ